MREGNTNRHFHVCMCLLSLYTYEHDNPRRLATANRLSIPFTKNVWPAHGLWSTLHKLSSRLASSLCKIRSDVADPQKCAPPACYLASRGHSRSNGMSITREIRWKIWCLTSCLSRSIKVTGTDMDRLATYDFLLVIPC